MDSKPSGITATDLQSRLESALQQSSSPEQFARRVAALIEVSDDAIWDMLALLDQHFRLGRIPLAYFRAASTSIGNQAIGLLPPEESATRHPVVETQPEIGSSGQSTRVAPVPERPIESILAPTSAVESTPAGLSQPVTANETVSVRGPARHWSQFRIFPPRALRLVAGALCLTVVALWLSVAHKSIGPMSRPVRGIASVDADAPAIVPPERATPAFASGATLRSANAVPAATAVPEISDAADLAVSKAPSQETVPMHTSEDVPVLAVQTGERSKAHSRTTTPPSSQCAEALLRASLSPRDTSAASSACQ
jgi:hypothetical protein